MGDRKMIDLSFLKDECETCGGSRKCDDCQFRKRGVGRYSRYNLEALGTRGLKKHHIYFFLHHPELNWELPPLPGCYDDGTPLRESEIWEVHHKNEDHFDDRKENTTLILKSEHARIHGTINNLRRVKEGTHQFLSENRTEELHEKIRAGVRKTVENGTHIGIRDNPNKYRSYYSYLHPQGKRLHDFLQGLNDCYTFDKEACDEFGYSKMTKLKRALEAINAKCFDSRMTIETVKFRDSNTSHGIKELVVTP